jgi:hypothetical protein
MTTENNKHGASQHYLQREQGYREKALKMYPWICGRCAREFGSKNIRELTVHHRDHNHDNNPSDGSWGYGKELVNYPLVNTGLN